MKKLIVIALLIVSVNVFAEGFLGMEWGTPEDKIPSLMKQKGYSTIVGNVTAMGIQGTLYAGKFSGDNVKIAIGYNKGKLVMGIIFYDGDDYLSIRKKYERNLEKKYGAGSGWTDKQWITSESFIYLPYEFMKIQLAYASIEFAVEFMAEKREAERDDF